MQRSMLGATAPGKALSPFAVAVSPFTVSVSALAA